MKDDLDMTEDVLSKYLAGEASPAEAMTVDDWAESSNVNRTILDNCCRIFDLPGNTSSSGDQPAWEKILRGIQEQEKSKRITARAWSIGIAASVVLLVFLGILVNRSRKNSHDLVYYTNTDTRKLQLKDSSEITLWPHSALTVPTDFPRSNRKLRLKGSGFFSVRHASTMPFILDMNGFYVQDLGTKFTIESSVTADTIAVAVREGKVSAYDAFGSIITIEALQKALYIRSTKKLALVVKFDSALTFTGVQPNETTTKLEPVLKTPSGFLTDTNVLNAAVRRTTIDPFSGTITTPSLLSVVKPGDFLSKADSSSVQNTTNPICDCDDTPPFKRFENLDINALSQAEYNQPGLLIKALQSASAEKRAMAVRQLGKLQLDKYLDDILAMMDDKECMVRVEVVNALGKFRNDKIGLALLPKIDDPSCFVREEIATELIKYGSLNGVEAALLVLSKDRSPNVTTQALYSLNYYKDDKLGTELLGHLQDKDEHPKVAAIYALKNFRADSIAILLVFQLDDPSKHVRQAAAEVLKYYNPKISRPALLSHLKADTSEHVQLAIIESLAAVGDDSAIDPLIAFVNDKRSIIRQLTIRALGVIGNKRVIPYLEAASRDENSFVRKEANDALKKLSKN